MDEGLIDLQEARHRVLALAPALEAETVVLGRALHRVLADDVRAGEDVPGFDNSAMDGFAVVAADTAHASSAAPARLAVVDESRAGRPATRRLGRGEAIRISTGAMVPEGADAVARLEDTGSDGERVEVRARVSPGQHLRRAGDDIRAGDLVIERGTRLGAAELGVLASVGAARVACARRPRLALVVTGDELREPGEPLEPGAIRDTNSYAVAAQAVEAGAEVVSVERVGDDPAGTAGTLARRLTADVLVVCGGLSVGPHDHVKAVLRRHGVREEFWGVALRPGKPTWFGRHEPGTLVFGLPGNPVSAMVCFALFVSPGLAAMTGADPQRSRVTAVMDEPYAKPPGRAHAVRCRASVRDDGWHVAPTKAQGSHVLTSMLKADGLAILAAERSDVAAGERVEVELLRGV